MKLEDFSILENALKEAEMILVGLGEEWWVQPEEMKQVEKYRLLYESLEQAGKLEKGLPFWMASYYETQIPEKLDIAYQNLHRLVGDKNYFIVSTCLDAYLKKYCFEDDRCVNPCGNHAFLQCVNKCGSEIIPAKECVSDFDIYLEKLCSNEDEIELKCVDCGSQLVFNNIYAENYSPKGYEKKWETYLKWLQGTVNKKLVVLELGVGMNFPTVIRWPFEKTVLYNQKSTFFRINETLSMLTPEISERGYSCCENSVDVISTCKKNCSSL